MCFITFPEPFPPTPSRKIVFQGTGPWCQKGWGPLCLKLLSLTWKVYLILICFFSHLLNRIPEHLAVNVLVTENTVVSKPALSRPGHQSGLMRMMHICVNTWWMCNCELRSSESKEERIKKKCKGRGACPDLGWEDRDGSPAPESVKDLKLTKWWEQVIITCDSRSVGYLVPSLWHLEGMWLTIVHANPES